MFIRSLFNNNKLDFVRYPHPREFLHMVLSRGVEHNERKEIFRDKLGSFILSATLLIFLLGGYWAIVVNGFEENLSLLIALPILILFSLLLVVYLWLWLGPVDVQSSNLQAGTRLVGGIGVFPAMIWADESSPLSKNYGSLDIMLDDYLYSSFSLLDKKEREIFQTLLKDGFIGSVDELIVISRKLSIPQ